MSSLCPCFRPLLPQRPHRALRFLVLVQTRTKQLIFNPRAFPSPAGEESSSSPKRNQLGFDPSEQLFELEDDLTPRNATRSWFGPSGQYIRELPCPSCRGRGYTPCTECGVERSRSDCSLCNGKGIMTCSQCSGDRVLWRESIDEQPWEKVRSSSQFRVKEDDEVDNLDIKLDEKRKSKRVYRSPSPEVGLKISRSLKSLNAKTGLFSNRMRIIHSDPILQAQRVAAIKKAKGTAAARKRVSEAMKAFFSNPENRHKRSISMKGVKFYCGNCGREGHRRHYCPELGSLVDRRLECRLCGQKGHNRRTCPLSRLNNQKETTVRSQRCKVCHAHGHNRLRCPQVVGVRDDSNSGKRAYRCRLCREIGHNVRTCPRDVRPSNVSRGLGEKDVQLSLVSCRPNLANFK